MKTEHAKGRRAGHIGIHGLKAVAKEPSSLAVALDRFAQWNPRVWASWQPEMIEVSDEETCSLIGLAKARLTVQRVVVAAAVVIVVIVESFGLWS